MSIHHGDSQAEVLSQAHECVINRTIAVRVKLSHDLAHYAGGLDVSLFWGEPHLGHLVDDATLDGFEAVSRVGEGPGVDDRIGVFQEGALHLIGQFDVDDSF